MLEALWQRRVAQTNVSLKAADWCTCTCARTDVGLDNASGSPTYFVDYGLPHPSPVSATRSLPSFPLSLRVVLSPFSPHSSASLPAATLFQSRTRLVFTCRAWVPFILTHPACSPRTCVLMTFPSRTWAVHGFNFLIYLFVGHASLHLVACLH